ncbi:unnamed protein product [Didymodactylos carnosus]|uniref:Uncharacterized protein n=1 Tax=Didymodactylos carnosus TaxID=1234261 RepID=A0A814K267_9BILA|nr:unnamed protein product [Didymodactylos carnosus]CAF1045680.1 unnamed protein product [Didymodactylos carnosus]CAF3704638.1 unnamed protein product [Didymodactylos carnosus]CAF3815615.1 unnamed protein product [Didymodactylos carnosus]
MDDRSQKCLVGKPQTLVAQPLTKRNIHLKYGQNPKYPLFDCELKLSLSTPTRAASNGDLSFFTGRTVENHAYARHYAKRSVQDCDVMAVDGFITSPKTLIQTNVPWL